MRWNFGGNLQPVRMICEYDWKECPIAVASYVWSEIVTDVVDGITGEAQLWRILAVVVLCSMLFHAYYKMRFTDNKIERDFPRDDMVKVDFKIQDLELKINILTYKMQYGNWPMPHEIPTPSLNQLRNVKLTMSNTSRKNMWTKHHLHGYISKCVKNSEEDKWKLRDSGNKRCKDYEKLIRTADECRKYMEEINESNKSLGLFDNSSDGSDNQYSSEETSHRFLVDPKKWHDIYESNNRREEETSESDRKSNKIFSLPNFRHKDSVFPVDEERQHPSKNAKNRSRLLPPGLSITFLSDKFKALSTSDKCVFGKTETSTNETLNRVRDKLESLHDIENSDSCDSRDDKCNELISSGCEEEMEGFEEKERRAIKECGDRQEEPPETCSENVANIKENFEKNINLSFVLCPKNKSSHQTPMETDEDRAMISGASSRTELSKDSDTDEKSTTTLLREALEFKKALMMQIQGKEVGEESECGSEDTFRSKIDNNFRPKVLDIISEEQSAGSSTEKTSRTYILSRTINETNLREEYERKGSKRDDKESELPCCGDSKSVVKSSSSEYFSTHNFVGNEQSSAQKVSQCVADGDGLREPKIDSKEEPESDKLRFFKSSSSIVSEKAISWNSVSESSSDENIAQFVNALANMESKNMCDYKGRSLATSGEDLRHRFLESNAKRIHDDTAAEEQKFKTISGKENQKRNGEGSSNHSQSHGERLHRKRDVLSKLKSLDAFTKPIDIGDCNREKSENDEDSSPLTGRTVVCISRSDSETRNQAIDQVSEVQREEGKKSVELEAKENLESKKTIVSSKKKNLSMSSITNFSTDTSDSYFDVSNHDFAVSSIILTSQNSNFVGNQRADPSKSDTSSAYMDASDRSISKIAAISTSAVKQEPSKPESSTKVSKSNKKSVAKSQSEQNQSSRTSDHDASKCWSNLNLDKSNSRAKSQSKSLIPVLKSRVDIPRRGKSMESKTRSRSSTRTSNTPRIQSARSNLNCQKEEKKNEKKSKKGATIERTNPKAVSADKKESKIVKPEPSKPSTAHLTKECTVIYINIVSDAEGNGAQTLEGKEITRPENQDDSNRQTLSLGDMKSNRTKKKTRAMNLGGPMSDSRLCEDLIDDARNGNEKSSTSSEAFLENATANKLLSTSTLELSNPVKVEKREMEVSVKPSVKNTSTSVSDFPDPSLESKRSFYNPNIEMFDVSNDLVQKEKIVLSEMLSTTTDPNFFECKKTQRLYNKLGLGFQEQSEQL